MTIDQLAKLGQLPLIIWGIAFALRMAFIPPMVDGFPANCGRNRIYHPEFWGLKKRPK